MSEGGKGRNETKDRKIKDEIEDTNENISPLYFNKFFH
jgi:hypothetical protein